MHNRVTKYILFMLGAIRLELHYSHLAIHSCLQSTSIPSTAMAGSPKSPHGGTPMKKPAAALDGNIFSDTEVGALLLGGGAMIMRRASQLDSHPRTNLKPWREQMP